MQSERVFVTRCVAIESRVCSDERSLVGRNRFGNVLQAGSFAKNGLEFLLVAWISIEPAYQFSLVGQVHLGDRGDGAGCLLLQANRPAIPKLIGIIGSIQYGGGMAA